MGINGGEGNWCAWINQSGRGVENNEVQMISLHCAAACFSFHVRALSKVHPIVDVTVRYVLLIFRYSALCTQLS